MTIAYGKGKDHRIQQLQLHPRISDSSSGPFIRKSHVRIKQRRVSRTYVHDESHERGREDPAEVVVHVQKVKSNLFTEIIPDFLYDKDRERSSYINYFRSSSLHFLKG